MSLFGNGATHVRNFGLVLDLIESITDSHTARKATCMLSSPGGKV